MSQFTNALIQESIHILCHKLSTQEFDNFEISEQNPLAFMKFVEKKVKAPRRQAGLSGHPQDLTFFNDFYGTRPKY